MNNLETIKILTEENNQLKEKLFQMEKELNDIQNQLNVSKLKSKQYYENNKEKIIERVKEYNKNNNYKSNTTSEKKKEYNKIAYLKKKNNIN
jgi:hypothetical protein